MSTKDSRITPAGAGKTGNSGCISSKNEDHPRRCGENKHIDFLTANNIGSPPQVRGKLSVYDFALARFGITPAGAGKTELSGILTFSNWDHPRRCGENSVSEKRLNAKIGSPPQVRGKLNRQFFFAKNTRITPAGAGKTYEKEDN